MASWVAHSGASQAPAKTGPCPWVAARLTMLTPGLGHFYLGEARRGIALFSAVMLAWLLLIFALMGVLARFWMCAVSLSLLLGLWLYIMLDATVRAARMSDYPDRAYNRWQVYGASAVAWVITLGLLVYAAQAGQLRYFRAAAASMSPTVRVGEYFLADATYYRTHHPSRGEVAVYVHPKQPDRSVIKRIVAIEGDLVAVKGGHAIVNGMAVAEPYCDPGPSDGLNAEMAEVRVPPGHVFMLGDNRPVSVDSRDALAHGPVPIENLIGRVTDIAFSNTLARMGRWIGTPSNL
ncbi:MAG: signal peptidase I [Xanthobacteraceae bacterium]